MSKKNKTTNKVKNILYFVIFPLLLGTVIYVSTRTNNIYFLKALNLENSKISLPNWIMFNLPDGLWAFSFSSLIAIIWQNSIRKEYMFWLIFSCIVSIIIEISYGTFDLLDLIFILIGFLIPFIYFKHLYLLTKIQNL
ncbi:MAG: hypothetical protein M9916_06910 [Crocinitomicaceae bacterium]|nr:hypothetical protein [Crocinitomicaceae bacterium]